MCFNQSADSGQFCQHALKECARHPINLTSVPGVIYAHATSGVLDLI